MVSIKTLTDL